MLSNDNIFEESLVQHNMLALKAELLSFAIMVDRRKHTAWQCTSQLSTYAKSGLLEIVN